MVEMTPKETVDLVISLLASYPPITVLQQQQVTWHSLTLALGATDGTAREKSDSQMSDAQMSETEIAEAKPLLSPQFPFRTPIPALRARLAALIVILAAQCSGQKYKLWSLVLGVTSLNFNS